MTKMQIFTTEELGHVRKAGVILRSCLEYIAGKAVAGITTAELDTLAEEFIRSHEGATPGFKGYHGFPYSICTSVNEQCVHGMPSDRELKDGDIISIDCGVMMEGLHTDACITVPVGTISKEAQQLLDTTKGALDQIKDFLKAGTHVGDISSAIQTYAEAHGCSVLKSLTGHGLGHDLHQFPDIPNFGEAGTGPTLEAGTIVAIEPILALGDDQVVSASDGWTLSTKKSTLSAHFEHTYAILEGKCEILA